MEILTVAIRRRPRPSIRTWWLGKPWRKGSPSLQERGVRLVGCHIPDARHTMATSCGNEDHIGRQATALKGCRE
jgi:hypothetical protein